MPRAIRQKKVKMKEGDGHVAPPHGMVGFGTLVEPGTILQGSDRKYEVQKDGSWRVFDKRRKEGK
jgi:hypothetical protein